MKFALVNLERSVWEGEADFVRAPGIEGELGIAPGHTPLLTALAPGPVEVLTKDGDTEVFYVSGGILEVQAVEVTLLADIVADVEVLQEEDLEAKIAQVREEAQSGEYQARIRAELTQATAQLRALQRLRQQKGRTSKP